MFDRIYSRVQSDPRVQKWLQASPQNAHVLRAGFSQFIQSDPDWAKLSKPQQRIMMNKIFPVAPATPVEEPSPLETAMETTAQTLQGGFVGAAGVPANRVLRASPFGQLGIGNELAPDPESPALYGPGANRPPDIQDPTLWQSIKQGARKGLVDPLVNMAEAAGELYADPSRLTGPGAGQGYGALAGGVLGALPDTAAAIAAGGPVATVGRQVATGPGRAIGKAAGQAAARAASPVTRGLSARMRRDLIGKPVAAIVRRGVQTGGALAASGPALGLGMAAGGSMLRGDTENFAETAAAGAAGGLLGGMRAAPAARVSPAIAARVRAGRVAPPASIPGGRYALPPPPPPPLAPMQFSPAQIALQQQFAAVLARGPKPALVPPASPHVGPTQPMPQLGQVGGATAPVPVGLPRAATVPLMSRPKMAVGGQPPVTPTVPFGPAQLKRFPVQSYWAPGEFPMGPAMRNAGDTSLAPLPAPEAPFVEPPTATNLFVGRQNAIHAQQPPRIPVSGPGSSAAFLHGLLPGEVSPSGQAPRYIDFAYPPGQKPLGPLAQREQPLSDEARLRAEMGMGQAPPAFRPELGPTGYKPMDMGPRKRLALPVEDAPSPERGVYEAPDAGPGRDIYPWAPPVPGSRPRPPIGISEEARLRAEMDMPANAQGPRPDLAPGGMRQMSPEALARREAGMRVSAPGDRPELAAGGYHPSPSMGFLPQVERAQWHSSQQVPYTQGGQLDLGAPPPPPPGLPVTHTPGPDYQPWTTANGYEVLSPMKSDRDAVRVRSPKGEELILAPGSTAGRNGRFRVMDPRTGKPVRLTTAGEGRAFEEIRSRQAQTHMEATVKGVQEEVAQQVSDQPENTTHEASGTIPEMDVAPQPAPKAKAEKPQGSHIKGGRKGAIINPMDVLGGAIRAAGRAAKGVADPLWGFAKPLLEANARFLRGLRAKLEETLGLDKETGKWKAPYEARKRMGAQLRHWLNAGASGNSVFDDHVRKALHLVAGNFLDPEQMTVFRQIASNETRTMVDEATELMQDLKALKPAERERIYHEVTDINMFHHRGPEAKKLGGFFSRWGKRLVELGALKQEQYDMWHHTYMPRVVEKYISKAPAYVRAMKDMIAWMDEQRGGGNRAKTLKGSASRGMVLKGMSNQVIDDLLRGQWTISGPTKNARGQNRYTATLGTETRTNLTHEMAENYKQGPARYVQVPGSPDPQYVGGWKDRRGTRAKGQAWRDWTPEERLEHGEIQDAAVALSRFVEGAADDLSNGALFEAIGEDSDVAVPASVADANPSKYGHWVAIDSDPSKYGVAKFGVLKDYRLRPDLAHALAYAMHIRPTMAQMQKFLTIRFWKKNMTARDLSGHYNQLIGNLGVYKINGAAMSELPLAVEDMAANSPAWKEFKDLGGTRASYAKNEFMEDYGITKLRQFSRNPLDVVTGAIQVADEHLGHLYAASDDMTRYAYYRHRLGVIEAKQGKPPTQDQKAKVIEEIAHDFYTGDKSSAALDMVEVGFPFLKFQAWAATTLPRLLVENPIGAIEFATWGAFLMLAGSIMAARPGETTNKDESEDATLRNQGEVWPRGYNDELMAKAGYPSGSVLQLPWRDEKGRAQGIGIRAANPLTFGNLDEDGPFGGYMPEALSPRGPAAILGRALTNRDEYGNLIDPGTRGFSGSPTWGYLAEKYSPRTIQRLGTLANAMKGEPDRGGLLRTPTQAAANVLLPMFPADIQVANTRAALALKRANEESTARIIKAAVNARQHPSAQGALERTKEEERAHMKRKVAEYRAKFAARQKLMQNEQGRR